LPPPRIIGAGGDIARINLKIAKSSNFAILHQMSVPTAIFVVCEVRGSIVKVAVGKAAIEFLESNVDYFETPMAPLDPDDNSEQKGSVSKFRITTTDDLDMVLGLVTWPAAKPEVRSIEFIDGLKKYERLSKAGRMGILPFDEAGYWVAELRAMKIATNPWATLNAVTLEELSVMAQSDAASLLIENGALELGSRAELFGDNSRRKNYLAMKCKPGDTRAVAVAFALTRVLPVMHDFGLSEKA
jgi:hypothetical protein